MGVEMMEQIGYPHDQAQRGPGQHVMQQQQSQSYFHDGYEPGPAEYAQQYAQYEPHHHPPLPSASMAFLEREMSGASISSDPMSFERLYVSSLPKTITEGEVRQLFSPFGQLTELQLHRRSDGTFKGSACVAFSTPSEGSCACSALHHHLLPGAPKPIVIKPYTGRRREPRTAHIPELPSSLSSSPSGAQQPGEASPSLPAQAVQPPVEPSLPQLPGQEDLKDTPPADPGEHPP